MMCVIYTSISNISKSPNISHIGLFSLYILYSYYNAVTRWSFLNKTLFAKQRVLFVFKAFVNKGFRNVFLYMLMTGNFVLEVFIWGILFFGEQLNRTQ